MVYSRAKEVQVILQKEINKTLNEIRLNLNIDKEECEGTIMISDSLN